MNRKRSSVVATSWKADGFGSKRALQKKGVGFFREMQEEMRRVSWTPKDELLLSTKIVLFAVFIMGLGISFVDLLIRSFIHGMDLLVRLIG